LQTLTASLNALSPLAVLERGYSLSKRLPDGQLVRDVNDLAVGDLISTLFAQGSIVSEVRSIEPDE
jgi:exodeoxyribonuclease VII large subunit